MFSFSTDAFVRIGDGMRRLELQAAAQERQAESILAAAETGEQLAMVPLAQPREVSEACVDRFEMAAMAQLRRYEVAVAGARRLCVAAREHRLETQQMASNLRAGNDNGETPVAGRRNRAVLVVDDYEDGRELLCAVLRNAGFVVRSAGNGLEAILAAYEMRPAVIVMDLTMPVLDGFEATRLIKRIDALAEARIIAYTAQPLADRRLEALFAAVLEKPAQLDVVLATVRQLADA